jgi:hypothetical protein
VVSTVPSLLGGQHQKADPAWKYPTYIRLVVSLTFAESVFAINPFSGFMIGLLTILKIIKLMLSIIS